MELGKDRAVAIMARAGGSSRASRARATESGAPWSAEQAKLRTSSRAESAVGMPSRGTKGLEAVNGELGRSGRSEPLAQATRIHKFRKASYDASCVRSLELGIGWVYEAKQRNAFLA
jgi:hypothetical protein